MAGVKPHAKVHVSVAHHRKTREVWADPAQRGMLVEVWRLGVERYAAKNGDTVGLTELDRLAITGAETKSEADRRLIELFRSLKYRVRKYPNRWDVRIRNFAKKHGIGPPKSKGDSPKDGKPKRKERREKREETRNDDDPASRDGPSESASLDMPEGYESPERLLRLLRLNAHATEHERAVWAEAVWLEVVAAAEDECGAGKGTLANLSKRILSARWNAYLRERDPERRQYHREANLRAIQAAKAALDREPAPDGSVAPLFAERDAEPEPDDPLAYLRAGENPHARSN